MIWKVLSKLTLLGSLQSVKIQCQTLEISMESSLIELQTLSSIVAIYQM